MSNFVVPHPRHIACNSGGAVRVAVWLLPSHRCPSQVDLLCVKLSRGTPIDFANFCEKGTALEDESKAAIDLVAIEPDWKRD